VPSRCPLSARRPERRHRWRSGRSARECKALKVKVGIEPEADVARVKQCAQRSVRTFGLGSDATAAGPRGVARQPFGMRAGIAASYFAEQPVAPISVQWMADVRRECSCPSWRDESCYTLQDAMALVAAGAAESDRCMSAKGGGNRSGRKIARRQEPSPPTHVHIHMHVGSKPGDRRGQRSHGISPRRQRRVVRKEVPCDILGPLAYQDDCRRAIELRDGEVRAPDKPGLRVRVG